MRRANDVRPETESWSHVEKKLRRAQTKQLALISTSVAILIAAIAVLVPRLHATKAKGFVGPGTPTASVSTGPELTKGVMHVGADQGFQISIPKSWSAGWWEGVYEYEPNGLPSLAQGGDTFAISVHLVAGSYRRSGISGAEDANQPTSINGHPAMHGEYVDTGTGARDAVYQIQWITCMNTIVECSSNFQDNTLVVIVRGTTPALWNTHWPEAQAVVGSINTYDGTTPAHLLNPSTIETDALSAVLFKFLDARVEGVNAEAFMSDKAQADFSDRNNCLDLYRARTTNKAWTSYELVNRIEQGSGKAKFLIMMHTDPNTGGFIEGLIVGPGSVSGMSVSTTIAAGENSCLNTAD
jgi:hypothetical protein